MVGIGTLEANTFNRTIPVIKNIASKANFPTAGSSLCPATNGGTAGDITVFQNAGLKAKGIGPRRIVKTYPLRSGGNIHRRIPLRTSRSRIQQESI